MLQGTRHGADLASDGCTKPNARRSQGHPGYRTPTRAPVTRQTPSARVLRLVVVLSSSSLPFFPSPHLASKSNALRPPHPSPRPCVEPPHSHLPISVRLPRRNKDSDSDSFLRRSPTDRRSRHSQETMGHDKAVVTQISGKTPFPAKDQPAAFPYLDWSAMQSYYGPGILPPAFFNPGHVPPPFMWAPQNLPTPAFGKPYAAIYPHAGGFLHPFMPLMVNPLNAEPAKSVNSKDDSLNKKLKETDGTAVSTGSGNSEKTSGDYSLEGSSDGNNQRACETPKKRTIDDMATSGAKTCGASIPKHKPREPGELATLANLRIPDVAVKPCASAGSDFRVGGTPSTEWSAKDDKELKRERRKQSNRESARRSRLRKQAETEELARKVELLTAENASLQNEINKLKESSQKLRMENSALMEKLKVRAPDDDAQDEPPDQTHTATAPPPVRVVKNFLSTMDGAGAPRHMEHDAPRLRQLLGSSRLPADMVAAS